ncbi:hypothetical protein GCM10020295_60230 [Streptomyces cinereospinus]
MRDAAEQGVGPLVRVVQQVRGEGGDGAGQGLLLGAGCLVAAVEQVAEQFRTVGEEAGVEALGDLADGGADDGEGGADGGCGRGGEHLDSSGLGWRHATKTCI